MAPPSGTEVGAYSGVWGRTAELDGGLTVRCRLPVGPVSGHDAQSAHPVNVQAALRAVEAEVLQLAFEVGLHLQELEPEHLGVDDERI
jgi:hypothetical protein